jgi:hypothetical protein
VTLTDLLRALEHGSGAIPGTGASSELTSALLDQADRHGMSAFLAHQLGELAPARLQQARLIAISRALRLQRLTHFVLDGLRERGVIPVLLKGVGLASRYWPSRELRPSGDVDVLVSPDELDAVSEFLRGAGFLASAAADPDHPHHRAFASSMGLVEVHFRAFTGPGGGSLDGLRTIASGFDGRPVRYLAVEEEVVYLASHAAQHFFTRLAWLVDLKLLAQQEAGLDWHRVVEVASRSRLRAATHSALVLAARRLGAPIPEWALEALAVTPGHERLVLAAFTPERLDSAAIATSRAAAPLRALLSDSARGAMSHLVDGAARRLKRAMRERSG